MNRPLCAALTASLALLALACGPSAKSAPAAPADVYEVRAEIAQLPKAPGGDVFLHHETIPDFRSSTGDTIGMAAMTMPFTPDDAVDLSGLAAGDRVAVTFEVHWEPKPALLLTRVEPLPHGTRLEFDPAEPEPSEGEPADEAVAGDSPDASR